MGTHATQPLMRAGAGPAGLERVRAFTLAHAPSLLAGVFALLAAFAAADALWSALAPRAARGGVAAPVAAPPSAQSSTYELLARVNPFTTTGGAPATAVAASTAEISETTLDLELSAIRAADGDAGAAIIRVRGEERVIRIGETILPGVVLHAVEADRAVIARAGVLEAVSLDRPTAGGLARPAAPTSLTVVDRAATAGEGGAPGLGGPASSSNPRVIAERLGRLVELRPQINDGGVSLALYPKGDDRAFRATGLQPGDVLIAVAGTRVDGDPTALATAIQSAPAGAPVPITVERGGAPVALSFDPQVLE